MAGARSGLLDVVRHEIRLGVKAESQEEAVLASLLARLKENLSSAVADMLVELKSEIKMEARDANTEEFVYEKLRGHAQRRRDQGCSRHGGQAHVGHRGAG